jgi:hypothetical protein
MKSEFVVGLPDYHMFVRIRTLRSRCHEVQIGRLAGLAPGEAALGRAASARWSSDYQAKRLLESDLSRMFWPDER